MPPPLPPFDHPLLTFALSMWPLLKRDGLGVQYVALLILWNKFVGYNPLKLGKRSWLQLLSMVCLIAPGHHDPILMSFVQTIYATCAVLHVAEALFTPPARLPDLFPVLNVLVSTPVFALVWLWSIKRGVEVSWALGGLGSRSSTHATQPPTLKKPLPFPSDGRPDKALGNGEAPVDGLSSVRGSGFRTMSLGFAEGRRRKVRSGSVDLH